MLAYILNISGWLLLPFMDGIAKYLSSEIHFIQVVWGRYFFMLLVSFPLAFIFFRIFDIWKPFPISYFDKNFKNGFGIVLDDLIAGVLAIIPAMFLIYLGFL